MNDTLLRSLDGCLLDGLEFCRRTYDLFETVRAKPDGIDRLRLRAGVTEKRLLEELLPICRYVQTYYRAGRYINVRWVNGSQSYDAELEQRGEYINQGYYAPQAYLEATCVMHANEHWIWNLLSEGKGAFAPEGITKERKQPVQSVPVGFTNLEHVESFAPLVLSQIRKKAEIPYPEQTSLVVQCSLNSLYTAAEWQALVQAVQQELRDVPFTEVLLFDGTTERSSTLAWPR
jgi:hypothetical protein